jgi:uncharacterized protein (DUF58 family)
MTLLLGFSAVNTGNNLLYFIVASFLAFMAVSGVAGWLNIRGISAELRFPEEVYRQRPVIAAMTISNEKRLLPSFLLELRILGSVTLVPMIPCRDAESRNIALRFPQRGEVMLDSIVLASRFPINFFVRSIPLPLAATVTVFPEPLPAPFPPQAEGRVPGAALAAAATGVGGEVKRIGDYTGREPLRQVHWRLSARHGDLKVKEFETLSGPPLLLDLNTLPGAGLEERLSVATHLVNLLCRQGRSVGLRAEGHLIAPGGGRAHRLRLLRELARYGTL